MKILARACAQRIPLADQSVHCVVTSPPYWGLRDYGTAEWTGGDPDCDHLRPALGGIKRSTLNAKRTDDGYLDPDGKSQPNRQQYAHDCPKCGAARVDRQLGLERTPDEYVANMVAVFREVWRVLRDDGTCWLNLGDSYAGSNASQGGDGSTGGLCRDGRAEATRLAGHKRLQDRLTAQKTQAKTGPGLKPKDLCMIPARVALALQADGWFLRSEIVWHKPNPMPESVTDRPTKAHEMVYLLTKRKTYYYDAEAVKEPAQDWGARNRNGPAYTGDGTAPGDGRRHQGCTDANHAATGRNRRTVWTVATQPYSGAHFATFPPKLIEPCILAGAPKGGIVLDPFVGSGTTIKVANEHGRNAVGLDINPEYFALSKARTNQPQARFA